MPTIQHMIAFQFPNRLDKQVKTNNKLELEEMAEHGRALARAKFSTATTFTILRNGLVVAGPFPCR